MRLSEMVTFMALRILPPHGTAIARKSELPCLTYGCLKFASEVLKLPFAYLKHIHMAYYTCSGQLAIQKQNQKQLIHQFTLSFLFLLDFLSTIPSTGVLFVVAATIFLGFSFTKEGALLS